MEYIILKNGVDFYLLSVVPLWLTTLRCFYVFLCDHKKKKDKTFESKSLLYNLKNSTLNGNALRGIIEDDDCPSHLLMEKSDLQPQAQQDSRNIQQDEWEHPSMEAGY